MRLDYQMEIDRFRMTLGPEELNSVEKCFSKKQLAIGGAVSEFEKKIANLANKKFCICVSNGFAALHLSLEALGLKNKNILVPAVSTCFAFINAIKASGNKAVLADVKPESGNLSYESVRNIISQENINAIISPNHFGIQSDVKALKSFGMPVIEDAAQSIGTAKINNYNSHSDCAIFSFYPTKILNAIDGGAIVTDNEELFNSIKDRRYYSNKRCDDTLRYNYKMININASVGLSSLEKLSKIINIRNKIAQAYIDIIHKFEGVDFLFDNTLGQKTCFQKFILIFKNAEGCSHFIREMEKRGIPCKKELLFLGKKEVSSSFPNSQQLLNMHCSLPFYETLSSSEINYIKSSMTRILENLNK